jgi:dTMP kinase
VAEVILPALASHDVVICDRFADSSVAYQGHGRGLGLNHVRVANLIATQGLAPDLTVVLNVADLGCPQGRRAAPDRIGGETLPTSAFDVDSLAMRSRSTCWTARCPPQR